MALTPRRRASRPLVAAFALLVLGLATAGCGAGGATTVSSPTTPSPSSPSGPASPSTTRAPTAGGAAPAGRDVAHGRYVRPVQVTGLHISPLASPSPLGLTWKQAETLFASVDDTSGMGQTAILGSGQVTLTGIRLPRGVPTLEDRPAWIGITWGGTVDCPLMKASATTVPFRMISTAVVIYGSHGHGGIVYTGRGTSPCGGPIHGPSVAPATSATSVPWTQAGPEGHGSVLLSYRAPSCTSQASTGGSGNTRTNQETITVDVDYPLDRSGCGAPTVHRTRFQYTPPHMPASVPSFHDPTLRHGPTGLVAGLQVSRVLGDGA